MEFPALQSAAERIASCAAGGTPLYIRGGGSKDFYGEVPQGEVLDARALAGIVSYEPSELVVTVRAGTPLTELEAALAGRGQCLPFEPPHFAGGATIGGMVAAGLSGPARASVGGVRDYVLGATIVNGKGEILRFGGTVMKNVAGYDVSRLMVGALGTLGLIAEVSLKVLPFAPAEATLKFNCTQGEALAMLHAWGGQPLPLNASCWRREGDTELFHVRLRGAAAAVEAACARMGGERRDNAKVAPHWSAIRDQTLPWFTQRAGHDLWRLSLPQTAPVLDLPNAPMVEWHGAQRWVFLEPGDAAGAARLRGLAAQHGGSATLFRAADGLARRNVFAQLNAPLDRIQRELKREFDPAGILNRGRLYPDF